MDTHTEKREMNVSFSHNATGMLRIYIEDILHLAFSTEKMQGLQSWEMTTRTPNLFCIEITMVSGEPVVAEYATRDLWLAILSAINKALGTFGATNAVLRVEPRP